MNRAAIYSRVSTYEQTTENQRRELEQVAERSGWQIVEVYEGHAISGTKGRDQRPEFDRLCRDAARRRFDVIMAWSVDRLGRSLKDLVSVFSEIDALGLDLHLHQQAVDTRKPAGRAALAMTSVFSEFEAAISRESPQRSCSCESAGEMHWPTSHCYPRRSSHSNRPDSWRQRCSQDRPRTWRRREHCSAHQGCRLLTQFALWAWLVWAIFLICSHPRRHSSTLLKRTEGAGDYRSSLPSQFSPQHLT